MYKKKDKLEQIIRDELQKEADTIFRENEKAREEELTEYIKEEMREKIQKKIDTYEQEKVYSQLSEEDREALKIGRNILRLSKAGQDNSEKEEDTRILWKKKRRKMYLGFTAVIVLVLAVGMTSLGDADRIVAIMKSMVGGREVVKFNSDEDNMVIVREDEEEAYQKIKDVFGTAPVKIMRRPQAMVFQSVQIDESLLTAQMLYKYEERNLIYIISASYVDTSWGVDVEDEITDHYYFEKKGQKMEIKEYHTPNTKLKRYPARYSARFSNNGLEYFMMGTMNRQEFEEILYNLYFYH